jgi:hypothetical protein
MQERSRAAVAQVALNPLAGGDVYRLREGGITILAIGSARLPGRMAVPPAVGVGDFLAEDFELGAQGA